MITILLGLWLCQVRQWALLGGDWPPKPGLVPFLQTAAGPKKPLRVERFEASGTQAAGMEGRHGRHGPWRRHRPALGGGLFFVPKSFGGWGFGPPQRGGGGAGGRGGAGWGLILLELVDGFWRARQPATAGGLPGRWRIPADHLTSDGGYEAKADQGAAGQPVRLAPVPPHSIPAVAWPRCSSPTFKRVLDLPSGSDPTVRSLLPEKPGRLPLTAALNMVRVRLEVVERDARQENEPRLKGQRDCRTCSRRVIA